MIEINWKELNKPKGVDNLIDELTYSNYSANRGRGMSHDSLAKLLNLSDGAALFYAERYENNKENENE